MPSRSPYAYQRRKQMRPLNWPSSTFSPGQMLIHQYPDPNGKSLSELIAGEGAPPSDRVILNSWSPPGTTGEAGGN
jgi:hypothetical protein